MISKSLDIISSYWCSKSNAKHRLPIKNIYLILGFSLIILFWQSAIVSFAATLCLNCHPAIVPQTEIQVTEWNNSEHANSLETLKASPDAEDACLKCHTADYVFDENITLEQAELNNDCAVCHEDHVSQGILKDVEPTLLKPKAEVCNDCHSTDGAEPGEIPQAAQFETFAGTGGVGVDDSPGIHYQLMADGCVKCHYFKENQDEASEVGGHTFKANMAVCLECHENPEEKRNGAEEQVSDKLAELEPLIEAFEDKESENFKNAKFNFDLVRISGDHGVHNLTYSNNLLDYSLSILKGEEPVEEPKEESCLTCHKALSVEEVAGWEESEHAKSLDTLKASPDAEDSCLQCHSVDYRNDPTLTLETVQLPNGCGSCHADHNAPQLEFSGIGKNLLKPKNEVCNDCHTAEDAKPGETPQSAQLEIFMGTGGIGVSDSPSIHSALMKDNGCVHCHTPSMTTETGEEISHTFEANISVCSTCHEDPQVTLTQAQEQISAQLTEITKLLDEYVDKESENFENAKFNFDLVRIGASGAHNLEYSLNLLEYSKSLLEAPDVNKDGIVDISDLDIISSHFGESVVDSPNINPDVDGNGTVDISDLALIGIHFGEITAPAAPAIAATDGADK